MISWRPSRAEWITFAGYLAITIYFTYPLLESGARLGISDWDALLFQHASVIKSLYEYGQMPFWNPWYCGGNVLWQNPQAPLLTPIYLLVLVMPLAVAMKLNILVHYLVGFIGPLEIDPATRLAFVRVSPGAATRAEVSFFPPGLLSGLILLLSGLLVSAAIWRRTLRRVPENRVPAPAAMRS